MRGFFSKLWNIICNIFDFGFIAIVRRALGRKARRDRAEFVANGGKIPGFWPEAISNKKLRRAVIKRWVDTGVAPIAVRGRAR